MTSLGFGRLCALVLLAFVASCASADSDDGSASAVGDDPRLISASENTVASPLAAHLGFGATEEFAKAFEVRRAQRIEAEIDVCMGNQGFEYLQKPVSVETIFGTPFGAELDRLTYAERYGLSVSTLFESQLQEPSIVSSIDGADPNIANVRRLTPAEQDAWYAALGANNVFIDPASGTAFDGRTGDVLEAFDGSGSSGCVGQALQLVDDEFRGLSELLPQLAEIAGRVDSDERVVDSVNGWRDCMSAQGYPYESRDQMWRAASADFQPLRNEILRAIRGDQGEIIVIEEDDDNQSNSAVPSGPQAALDEHKQREIEIAVASYECDSGIEAVRSAVRAEYETDFVQNNQSTLDAIGGQ